MAEETVTVDPDGSTHYESAGGEESTMPPVDEGANSTEGMFDEETMEEVVKGTDPAIYLLLAAILIGVFYFLYLRKKKADEEDEFFSNLDGEKVCPKRFYHLYIVKIIPSTPDLTLICCSFYYRLSSISNYPVRWTNTTISKKRSWRLDGFPAL